VVGVMVGGAGSGSRW